MTPAPPRHRLRSALAALLVVVGCVLAPFCVVAVWVSDEVGDTDRYVATMAPLAADPAVQDAVATRITTALTQRLDLTAQINDAAAELPPRLGSLVGALSAPIADGVQGFVRKQADRVVGSDAFATVWTTANRAAHTAVDTFLTGENEGAVQTQGDEVVLDLGPLVDRVKQALVDDGFSLAAKVPELHTQYVLLSSSAVPKAQKAFSLLRTLGVWLPVTVLVLLALGVLLAARRRRCLVAAALGLCAGMALLALGLVVGRHLFLGGLPDTVSVPAAAAVFDTVVHFIRTTLWTVFGLAALVALGGWLLGPSRPAVALRARARRLPVPRRG
ncbi:hypothetical protein ACEZDB_09420 [Streptacidiphilus sp. N1-3]|uniref:Integral membrane protein n=1 Tax=Streptacidiphilus alkalitolerans TaxID=3342712 RepID=A0ABV6WY08_9ACTN